MSKLRIDRAASTHIPEFSVETAITQLGVGEALISALDEKGAPTIVQRTLIRPPRSKMGPAAPAQRAHTIEGSRLSGRYDQVIDRESAYEKLAARAKVPPPAPQEQPGDSGKAAPKERGGKSRSFMTTIGREIGRQASRELIRGLMGSLRR